MERLFKSTLSVGELRLHKDDNYVDRLSRLYTVMIVVSFSFLVTTKQFVGSPIHCWCPAQFTDSHVDYANSLCWVTNTYYLPMERPIPGGRFSSKSMISYYQWVPLILLLQGLLALLPSLLWRFLNKRSGIDVGCLMDAAQLTSEATYFEIREKAVRYIVNQMNRYLLSQRDYAEGCSVRLKLLISKLCCFIGGKDYGNYLVVCYLFVKAMYVLNAVGQIFLLSVFLGDDYRLYGLHVVEHLARNRDWGNLPHFPRVTLCEFAIRDQSRVHSYVVQCALTINLFNEKIFVFLWFWLVLVTAITLVDLLVWVFRSFYWPGQVVFVRKRLHALDAMHREPSVMAKFTQSYLRRDGLLIVRLIGLNMGDVVAAEVICGLWNNYSPERRIMAEQHRLPAKVHQNGNGHRMEMV